MNVLIKVRRLGHGWQVSWRDGNGEHAEWYREEAEVFARARKLAGWS